MLAFLLMLLRSKWTWIAVGVVVLITSALIYVDHKYNQGVAAWQAQVIQAVQKKTIAVQQKMDKAQAAGPKTESDVVKRLRAESF